MVKTFALKIYEKFSTHIYPFSFPHNRSHFHVHSASISRTTPPNTWLDLDYGKGSTISKHARSKHVSGETAISLQRSSDCSEMFTWAAAAFFQCKTLTPTNQTPRLQTFLYLVYGQSLLWSLHQWPVAGSFPPAISLLHCTSFSPGWRETPPRLSRFQACSPGFVGEASTWVWCTAEFCPAPFHLPWCSRGSQGSAGSSHSPTGISPPDKKLFSQSRMGTSAEWQLHYHNAQGW